MARQLWEAGHIKNNLTTFPKETKNDDFSFNSKIYKFMMYIKNYDV